MSVAEPSEANAQAEGPHTLSIPDALTIKASGGVPCRLRFKIIDPAVKSVLVLGLAHPIRVTEGVRDAVVPAHTGEDRVENLSLIVQYRDETGTAPLRDPIEVTLQP